MLRRVKWLVIFAMVMAFLSGVDALIGQTLLAIYVLLMAGFMLGLDSYTGK
jgi:cytochrome b subunit of formate dehydrogenase